MPISATFDYIVVVPACPDRDPWQARLLEPVVPGGDKLRDRRLVGYAPRVEISNAGETPNPGYSRGVWRPKVERSRIQLLATDRNATVDAAFFHVDRDFIGAAEPGDAIHMARPDCGGLAVSILRGDRLVAAAGALTLVPLGEDLIVRSAGPLFEDLEETIRRRDPGFHFPELPVEVRSGGQESILFHGTRFFGDLEINVLHGFRPGIPGEHEALAARRKGLCGDVAAVASATLMDADGIQIPGRPRL